MAYPATKKRDGDPATRKRGGDPDVKQRPPHERPDDPMERKLDEGLEESMTGSDPVSIVQPVRRRVDKEQSERKSNRAG